MKLVITLLIVAAVWIVQCMVGGTRLAYSLPSYLILAVAGLLSLTAIRRPVPRPGLVCLFTTALLFAYVLARAMMSPVAYLWWQDFYMVLACLVTYLITVFYVSSSRLRMIVVVGLLALAIVEVLVGLRQFQMADNWMPFGFVRSNYGARASGMFISSIHLAGYLEAVGVIGLSVALWSSWNLWARIAVGYVALMCYIGIAITGSRGGYISSVFSLLVFAVISLRVRRAVNPGKFARSALIAAVALIAFLSAAVAIMQRSELLRARMGALVKRDVRFYNWQAALDQFKVSPVIGTGAGTHLYYGRYFRRPEIQFDPEHAHNDYLEMLAEYGLIGLAGMAVFVFVHVHSGFRGVGASMRGATGDPYRPFQDNRLALQIGALAAIASYISHSVTDFNLHIPGNALLFAFIFGITANPSGSTYPDTATAPAARFFQFILPALSIWLIASGAPKFRGDYWCERARAAMHYRDYRAAADFARKSIEREAGIYDSYYLLAGAYMGLASTERNPARRLELLNTAIDLARQGLKLFPNDEHAQIRLARALESANRFREAGDAYRAAIALDPNLGSLHALYARFLSRVGRLEEAQKEVDLANRLGSQRDTGALIRGTPLAVPPEE